MFRMGDFQSFPGPLHPCQPVGTPGQKADFDWLACFLHHAPHDMSGMQGRSKAYSLRPDTLLTREGSLLCSYDDINDLNRAT